MVVFNIFSRTYNNFNFHILKQSQPEKLKALFNYIIQFQKFNDTHSHLEVKYRRNSYKNESDHIIDNIKNSSKIIQNDKKKLMIINDHHVFIEKQDYTVQAVFAHARIGGRTLTDGYAQEEIRFCISPECIIIMLLCHNEPMEDDECITIDGAERFSNYSYVHKKFKCLDPYNDFTITRANTNTLDTRIIAFDALNYGTHNGNAPDDQYNIQNIKRDIIKLSSVFKTILNYNHPSNILSTGNWGVGDFQNNKVLKFCLQFLVASYYGVSLRYLVPGDNLIEHIRPFYNPFQNQ